MNVEQIKNVAVIGAGNMGHQIAALLAIHGYETRCMDTDRKVLEKAETFFTGYLDKQVNEGRLSEKEAQKAAAKLHVTQDLEKAVVPADFVIEAIVEMLDVKRKLFSKMDKLAPKHAILATNSSYIVSSKIADATSRPDKVCNMHFFNPALVMKLVEVVKGEHVSEETAEVAYQLSEKIGKKPVMLNKEVEGFLINRIVRVIRFEAYWLHEMGIASIEDIDSACVHGLGHPMGPFRLNDLVGLDLTYTMATEKFKSTGNPVDLPYTSLVKKYAQGKFGRKTGEGWYTYPNE